MTAGQAPETGPASTGTAPARTPPAGAPGAGRHTNRKPHRTVQRPSWFSLSNWPVATRLVVVFIAASVTGLVFGGLRVSDAVGAANGYARITQLAVLAKQTTLLAQDLENERDLTVGVSSLTSLQQDAAAAKAGPSVTAPLAAAVTSEQRQLNQAQRASSAAAVPVLQLAQGLVANSAFPVSVQNGANSVVAQVSDGGIDAVRLEVLDQPPAAVISDYSNTLSDLFALNAQVAGSSGDALLSNEVNALGALSTAKDQAAQQRAILYSAFIESGLNDAGGGKHAFNNIGGPAAMNYAGGLQALVTAQDLQLTDLATFQVAATEAEAEAYLASQAADDVATAQNIYTTVTSDNGDPQAIFPQLKELLVNGFNATTAPGVWYTDQSAVVNGMRSVENQLTTEIVARSQVLQHQAFESALLTGLATALVVILVLGATALIGRSLVNPLRRLQADALEIAAVRLPARVTAAAAGAETGDGPPTVEPIGVASTDEIGRVARAFDQVHAEAVRLAGTEAQLRGSLNSMFISLSRRSVPLIDRLARMIDSMEQNEDDSEQLANLFAMDHLVTRMRRNSENLLVLAGEEPVRKWTDSVPLTDVTRAAASEIEQYNRVALAVQPGIMISGQAAADVVHLLAELIENATLFSPQTTQVRVTVMELASGGVLVEVRDDGVGVSPSRLSDMNWRLDHPPVVNVSISRHMGLYAVSRLAARHGIRVKLRPGAPQGLSALVWLPGQIAKRGPVPAADDHSRQYGAETADLVTGFRPAAAVKTGSGRHRSALLKTSGEQQALAGPGTPAARPATVWFAAKRPSAGAARSEEELTADWQSPAGGRAGADGARAGRPAADGLSSEAEQAGQTTAGLPRRVPRTSAYPGPGIPDFGVPAAAQAAPAGAEAALLGAPPGGTGAAGVRYHDAQHQEQPPARRRSPEAARSRLAGFQLGSRDAVQTGQAAGSDSRPFAGEENGR
jgi:signal transduction histidine kinase